MMQRQMKTVLIRTDEKMRDDEKDVMRKEMEGAH